MEIGDLAIGMDSGIRPAGALDFHRLSGYPGKKALQLPLYSILRRSGGRGIPFSLSLGSQPFHYSKTMPQMKIFRFVRKKSLPL